MQLKNNEQVAGDSKTSIMRHSVPNQESLRAQELGMKENVKILA